VVKRTSKPAAAARKTFPIVLEKDGEGYFVYCPILEGAYTQGETYEEALKNIKEVIALCLEDEKNIGDLPEATSISFCTMEVQI
jgi:predicted RNase H-like HicB family nuclease